MAVRLRLRRMGRKKKPFYRIVVADQRSPRDGRFIENIGRYDPIKHPHEVNLDEERVLYWLQNGAQPSTTVRSLLRRKGILHRIELQKRGFSQEQIDMEMKKWELLQAERAKRIETKLAEKQKQKKEVAAEEAQEEAAEAEAKPVETGAAEELAQETAPEAAEPEEEKQEAKTPEAKEEQPQEEAGEEEAKEEQK